MLAEGLLSLPQVWPKMPRRRPLCIRHGITSITHQLSEHGETIEFDDDGIGIDDAIGIMGLMFVDLASFSGIAIGQ